MKWTVVIISNMIWYWIWVRIMCFTNPSQGCHGVALSPHSLKILFIKKYKYLILYMILTLWCWISVKLKKTAQKTRFKLLELLSKSQKLKNFLHHPTMVCDVFFSGAHPPGDFLCVQAWCFFPFFGMKKYYNF